MLQKDVLERLVSILKQDLKRIMGIRVPGFPRPYYASFLLRDIEWFNTISGSGSVYRRRSDHTRNVYCDLRVGSYKYDQITQGGLHDNDEELESTAHVSVPIDDNDYDGLRLALWRLSDAKYREAVSDFNQKRSASISTVDENRDCQAFTKLPSHRHIANPNQENINEEEWVKFCKSASRYINGLPGITSGLVEFDAEQVSKVLISTEGRVIVQHFKIFSLSATLRKLTKHGSNLEQDVVLHCGSLRELPDLREFKKLIREKYARLMELSKARKIHAYSGPVLLYPVPGGLLIHEAIGHRLEGCRLLSSSEGQTFKGQVGNRVLNIPITVRDNPKLKKFAGKLCVGAYDYDDEGCPARDALLIEGGVLKGFLTTRSPIAPGKHESNGHARNKKFQRPISRMAVTVAEAEEPLTIKELKAKLVEEVKRQGKPYGMIVYETSGGETETTTYDFQGFAGEISYATLVYPNGREVCVRGVNFVGTPLQALGNVIAAGGEPELDNGYCGAESGFIPVSTISPALLLSNLELQAKGEELVTQYVLPKPRVKRGR